VVKNWGDSDVVLRVNGKIVNPGKECRIGFENKKTGTDLISVV